MQTLLRQRFSEAALNFLHTQKVSGRFSVSARARSFLEQEPDLARLFLIEETERIMRHEERMLERPRHENVYQMFLLGFASLEERIPLKTGKIALAKATLTALEETLTVIRKKVAKHPEITRVEALIEGMRPYIAEHPGLTVGRYCELRAAGVPAGVPAPARAKAAQ